MAITRQRKSLKIEEGWLEALKEEFDKPYMDLLRGLLREEAAKGHEVYPPNNLIFNAMCQTPFDQVKVLIMGQDPYHGKGQAHGLSFSVPKGVAIPPSLQNIYKEQVQDIGIEYPRHGCLLEWANQGVLLLNATLSVRAGEPRSHYGRGWETFTDAIVRKIADRKDPAVFLLWGKSAQEKCAHILKEEKASHHLVLTAAHPSPFSAYHGFFGCRHFSKTNRFLEKMGKKNIDWQIH
jgi:uracil-DNA glycosylase